MASFFVFWLYTPNSLPLQALLPLQRFHGAAGTALEVGAAILEDPEFVAGFLHTSRSEFGSPTDM